MVFGVETPQAEWLWRTPATLNKAVLNMHGTRDQLRSALEGGFPHHQRMVACMLARCSPPD